MNLFLNSMLELAHKNKYSKWYSSIISQAKERESQFVGYGEKHHILPKSFNRGGEKDKLNIVKLTAREHFICHVLLVKMFSGHYMHKMARALLGMKRDPSGKRYFNARLYEIKRGKMKHTEEAKKKMSASKIGVKMSDGAKYNMAKSQTIRHRENPFTEQTRALLRIKNLGANNPAAMAVTIGGIKYSTRQEAKHALCISLKNIDKIARGECITIQEATTRKLYKPRVVISRGKSFTHNGIVYSSIKSAAIANNMGYSLFRKRFVSKNYYNTNLPVSIDEI